jgi:hypothetical protein
MISFTLNLILKETLSEDQLKKLYSQNLIYTKERTGNAALDILIESSMVMKFTQFDFHQN